jgi:hypothetical protein
MVQCAVLLAFAHVDAAASSAFSSTQSQVRGGRSCVSRQAAMGRQYSTMGIPVLATLIGVMVNQVNLVVPRSGAESYAGSYSCMQLPASPGRAEESYPPFCGSSA